MLVSYDHPTAGSVRTLGIPVEFSGTPSGIRLPAPLLGQHTREILREFGGYDAAAIDALIAGNAVRQA
jgi:crotonobetainyl-CoA:carnitine CoA-transferase CaiB-like acyl-CoA transferase